MDRDEVSALWCQYLALQGDLEQLEAIHPLAKQYRKSVIAAAEAKKPKRRTEFDFKEAWETIGDEAGRNLRDQLRPQAKDVFDELKGRSNVAWRKAEQALADLQILPGDDWRYVDGSRVKSSALQMVEALKARKIEVECRWFEPDKGWQVYARLADELDVAAAQVAVERNAR